MRSVGVRHHGDRPLKFSDVLCIICRRTMENALPRWFGSAPYPGLIFIAHGNYGSTVYDPSPGAASLEYLAVVICDACVVRESEHGNVLIGHKAIPPEDTLERWTYEPCVPEEVPDEQ